MSITEQVYQSFLLRLWAVKDNGVIVWRASLEYVKTGEKCYFTTLEGLFTYLRQVTGEPVSASQGGLNAEVSR